MDGKVFFVLIVILAVAIVPAVGQEALITVKTNDNNYDEGDTIIISGNVSTVIAGEPITLQIFFRGNVVYVNQIDVAQDGSYTHTVITGGTFRNSGEYTVRAQYGGEISETFFDFTSKGGGEKVTQIFEVDAGDKGTFDVNYTIEGGSIVDMRVNSNNFALEVEIEAVDDGTITLELDRDAIDAKKPTGDDEEFIILIDDAQISYKETLEGNNRVVSVDFEEGDEIIQIIGTFVIPEFGSITAVVLMAGIILVVLSSKNRFLIYRV